ncbi:LytTR family transcriptional regulator DNA-binding domain-containing protein [Aureisphaera galaxeae]|uniref:LytR/AlgR family response regulator transcription factor n=1 Tax=Aureisphaera galaxeae TaxID=1538023 RepID=UPI0023507AD2|nr:LytTR family transcriptional regulator DNA-binding domain-containing protein [Aureisphaera galaxeae]MDC8005772.1 LytTR family transcriptional regulator DNA-binding domain-containing protein [Aureisphaera galaxeae]
MEYPYIIIDNDPQAIEAIHLSMEQQHSFACVGVTSDEETGMDLILERRPSIVFLNIELPGKRSNKILFNLMNEARNYLDTLPEFVVLANTPEYAIDGIRNNILDYILKPLDLRILRRCLLRFQKRAADQLVNTLCFKSYGDYKFIPAQDVLYLKADNNTTDIVLSGEKVVRAFKTLKAFQDALPSNFMRIHNSYIVNIDHISRIHFGKSKCTLKNTMDWVPFSKSYRGNVEIIRDSLSNRSLMIV